MNPHRVIPTKSGLKTQLRWGASCTSAIACLWLGTPALGAPLNDWQFDPQTQELTVVLADGITPNYFLLAEPARIVFNLPNTQLGPVLPAQYYSGAIESIRVSQFDAESARVVVEFAPNTILDPRHAELSSNDLAGGTQWTLRPLVVDSPAGTTVALDPNRALPPPVSPAAATAYTAVAGAATAPQQTANDGIRTDASALIDDGTTLSADQPPGTLPIDPFAAAAAPQVSVPPLADSAAPSAPVVTVPPLADSAVPTVPAVTVPPADLPNIPSDQTDQIEAPAVTAPPVIAQAPFDLDADSAEGVPLIVTPAPEVEAVEPPEPITPTPSPATVPSPSPIRPVIPGAEPPRITTPTPPVDTAPAAAPTTNAPPFLEGTAATTAEAERRTIPPPPARSQPEGTIPFGAPLPGQAKATADGAIAALPGDSSFLPVGTRLSLQYPGPNPLVLDREEPWYEVLVLAEPAVDGQTGQVLLPAGTQVLGQFEGFDNSGRRFVVQAVVSPNGENQPLLAESEWLLGARGPHQGNLAANSGLGAAAVTILSGFSGVGLLGGAALGAAATYAAGPQLVTIQPGQIIVAEVVAEILPFH
jgi:hypothetical protein